MDIPHGSYTYEKLEEKTKKIREEMKKNFSKYSFLMEDIRKTNKYLYEYKFYIETPLIEAFESEIGWEVDWVKYNIIRLIESINGMLRGLKFELSSYTDDDIITAMINNIIYQLYDKENKNSILKCMIDREILSQEEYDSIYKYNGR